MPQDKDRILHHVWQTVRTWILVPYFAFFLNMSNYFFRVSLSEVDLVQFTVAGIKQRN